MEPDTHVCVSVCLLGREKGGSSSSSSGSSSSTCPFDIVAEKFPPSVPLLVLLCFVGERGPTSLFFFLSLSPFLSSIWVCVCVCVCVCVYFFFPQLFLSFKSFQVATCTGWTPTENMWSACACHQVPPTLPLPLQWDANCRCCCCRRLRPSSTASFPPPSLPPSPSPSSPPPHSVVLEKSFPHSCCVRWLFLCPQWRLLAFCDPVGYSTCNQMSRLGAGRRRGGWGRARWFSMSIRRNWWLNHEIGPRRVADWQTGRWIARLIEFSLATSQISHPKKSTELSWISCN